MMIVIHGLRMLHCLISVKVARVPVAVMALVLVGYRYMYRVTSTTTGHQGGQGWMDA